VPAFRGVLRGATRLSLHGAGSVPDYASALLAAVGADVRRAEARCTRHPALEWARSGAMALTGPGDGPPLLAPGPLASCAAAAVLALERLAGRRLPVDGALLLGERAAIFGLVRRGTIAPSGSCRLLAAEDGWLAVNLARPDDVSLLPAWLGGDPDDDPWPFVERRVAGRAAVELVERARLLGLPAALSATPQSRPPPWFRLAVEGRPADGRRRNAPLVLDLSSLWAGPLCAHLLGLAGARVVKVESTRRPDGMREGPAAFHDLMNGGKASVALDFRSDRGRAALHRLVSRADIVIESARPRALSQLGIDAEKLVDHTPGLTWLSITGYGRREPEANWVAFGDDAGVAAGLAATTAPLGGPPCFCGDAIADPLTGLHAAVAAFASWCGGGGHLLDLSLCDVTAHAMRFGSACRDAKVREVGGAHEVCVGPEREAVAQPYARRPNEAARRLGADTDEVLAELDIRC
jgi:crotonobetainyl-CoA:carnitine CoA-transferase CaiB-like acyl-CoA transferase